MVRDALASVYGPMQAVTVEFLRTCAEQFTLLMKDLGQTGKVGVVKPSDHTYCVGFSSFMSVVCMCLWHLSVECERGLVSCGCAFIRSIVECVHHLFMTAFLLCHTRFV